MWECDGCGFTGTEAEVEKHIIDQIKDLEWWEIDDAPTNCWGAMEVGGPAWTDFHEKGIHPMSTFLDRFEDRLMDSGMIVEVLKEEQDG